MTTNRPIIGLDADGVLLDYSSAYAAAWERAFSARPTERDPTAYWPIDRWNVPRLPGANLERFRTCFDDQFWSEIPAIGGALEACNRMLCCRLMRGSANAISNHSWGTAIDLTLDGVLDQRGDDKVQFGLTLIAPIFNRHGWYWGAGFPTEDGMHFEGSAAKIGEWKSQLR